MDSHEQEYEDPRPLVAFSELDHEAQARVTRLAAVGLLELIFSGERNGSGQFIIPSGQVQAKVPYSFQLGEDNSNRD